MTMTQAERLAWQQADRILDDLFDLPPDTRHARLAALALAPDLQQRVERLLAALQDADGVLDHPEKLVLPVPADALRGRRLGRWELDGEIGRGGMSVVYQAHSVEGPAGQDAAVKVLTLGALAGSGREQFLREQDLLLRLRHPYIAPMHDAGIAGDGTPWLAMARVEGERIDAWCDARGLAVAARVRLVLQVCEALAHAHRNLVIHRDIKPSNVLVDDDGRVRLLDFGIARLADAAEAERTATALRALTPEYAAPEQFSGAPATTAMDVYGIGALLYRLLAGVPPRAPGLRSAVAPVLPPSRAARANADIAGDARRGLRRLLRGDLDAIVMKALAPEPEARYPGVDAFADDLRRWLDGKPVRAQPPSLRYRARKFAARNRLSIAASAALLLALLGGLATTLWQAGIAREEAARARQAAEQSEAQLAYLHSVLEVLAPATEATRELDRHAVIAEAARRAQRDLGGRPALLASVQLSLGDVAQRAGDYAQARALFTDALRKRYALAGPDTGEYGEALAALAYVTAQAEPPDPVLAESRMARAVRTLRRHRPATSVLVRALVRHAELLGNLDRYEDAVAVAGEAAGLCRGPLREEAHCDGVWMVQGALHSRRNDYARAIVSLQQLVAWRGERLGDSHAQTAFARGQLGHAYSRLGEHARGIALLETAYRQLQRTSTKPTAETLQTMQNLAGALSADNQLRRAAAIHRECVALAAALFGERSDEVALSLSESGSGLFIDGRYREAAAQYRRAFGIYRGLYGPRGAATAITQANYADALGELGQHAQALALARDALAGYRAAFGPDNARTGSMWAKLGDQLLANARLDDALAAYDRALAILRAQPDSKTSRLGHAVVRSKRAEALRVQGRLDEAVHEARAAEQALQSLTAGEGVYYGLALANLVRIACHAHADDCGTLRRQVRHRLDDPAQPGGNRLRLQQALAVP